MRLENFKKSEHYFTYGRGSNGENIFIDDRDKARFVFLLTHFQSPLRIYNVTWYTEGFVKKGAFSTQESRVSEVVKNRNIELLVFIIMPDNFQILVKNMDDGILSVYMHRILTAYSKYFNAKYNKKGHVFDGPFKAVHVKNNNHLARLSARIHKSPADMKEWENSYDKYPYSSYQDYIGLNRWGHFLSTGAILKQFKDQAKYKDFVFSSKWEEGLDNLQNDLL